MDENVNRSAVGTVIIIFIITISTRQVVIKSHPNYGFVIYKCDTLIGCHILDNNTLKGCVWNLAHVYDDENGKQLKTVSD